MECLESFVPNKYFKKGDDAVIIGIALL